MEQKHLLWSAYWNEKRIERVYILKCTYAECKSGGAFLHRMSTDGVKNKSLCPDCNRAMIVQVEPGKLSADDADKCLLEPAFLSTNHIATYKDPFVLPGVSNAVVALYSAAVAAENNYRAVIGANARKHPSKYNEYIRPPGKKDIWLARAVMEALRIERGLAGSSAPRTGSVGVCVRNNGSVEIGFSGDSSKASTAEALIQDFPGVLKRRYPHINMTFAMAENTALLDKYYASFKTIKGGVAVQSTWERHCAESKFLDLATLSQDKMASCTVLWIGENAMSADFCMLSGSNNCGSPMLPCVHCQQLRNFLDEIK